MGPMEEDLRRKIKGLLLCRLLILTLLLGSSLLFEVSPSRASLYFPTLYRVIITTCAITLVSVFLLDKVRSPLFFAYCQVGADICTITGLVYGTGGVESPFSFLYLLSIISASILLSQKGGSIAASTSIILYGIVADLQYYQIAPGLEASPLTAKETVYLLFLSIVAFFSVSVMSGTLAERLEKTGERLSSLLSFHQNLIQSVASGVFTTDLFGRVSSFNRAAEQMTGYIREEVEGREWWEIFGWKEMADVVQKPEKMPPFRFEKETQRKDGSPLLIGMGLSPLRDSKGGRVGIVGICQDLTRIRRLEEEMRKKEKLATLGEIAAGIAHEIRNPLASLSGSMQMLNREIAMEGDAKRLMEIALREITRLNSIVNQFLHYARPVPLKKRWCDLNDLLLETMSLLRGGEGYRKEIEICQEVANGKLLLSIDPDQVKQVFWNLVLNACEAMPHGGRLCVKTSSLPGFAQVTFEDTGCGIPEEKLEQIFDPFFTTKTEGSGMGLAIVQKIVEAHRGTITVESQVGSGSRFTIRIPREGEL